MIYIIIIFVLVASMMGFTCLSMNFFEKIHCESSFISCLGTVLFSFIGVVVSIIMVTAVPANLAMKYCDYTPTYSHSRNIYDLRGEYVTELEDDYMIYIISSDSNNIYEQCLSKENTTIIDVETKTPYVNYYSPKFKNKLVDLYFCQSFTIGVYDICI